MKRFRIAFGGIGVQLLVRDRAGKRAKQRALELRLQTIGTGGRFDQSAPSLGRCFAQMAA